MRLADYLRPLAIADRHRLALAAGTTYYHLKNVAFSGKPCGEKLAVALERETAGAVKRWDCRPKDWHEIWPDLAGTKGAPRVPLKRAA
jgi:hypothetical protein